MNNALKQYIHEPIRASVVILIIRLFLVMFLFDVFYSLIELYSINLNVAFQIHRFIAATLFITHSIKNILLMYLVLRIIINWISNLYYITESYLVKHEGLINIKEKIIDLRNLRSVTVNQGLLGKLFHYGTIILTISASGGYNDEILLFEVDRPEIYKDYFQRSLKKSYYKLI